MLFVAASSMLATVGADASVVYEQYAPSNPPNGAVGSQDENLDGTVDGTKEAFAADDFTVPSGDSWRVQRVDVRGSYNGRLYFVGTGPGSDPNPHFTAAGPAESVDVYFYKTNGGTPSGVAPFVSRLARRFVNTNTQTDGHDPPRARGADLEVQLGEPVNLTSGTYWVAVWPRQDPGEHGYWYWDSIAAQYGSGAEVYGKGFGGGCYPNAWVPIFECGSGHGHDLAFRLAGDFLDGLTFQKIGEGRGTVTSTGGGGSGDFNCGPDDCWRKGLFKRFVRGSQVTFTARSKASGPNSVFSGWQGCDYPSGSTCVMYMNSPGHTKSLKARFDIASGLTIRKTGASDGKVTSDPAKVDCPVGKCKTKPSYYRFALGSKIWLIARGSSSSPTSVFVGWRGCDHPYGYLCAMEMNDAAHAKEVSAQFEPASGLTIQKRGAGDGSITSTPDKVKCPVSACKTKGSYYRFRTGTQVTLKAAPRTSPKSTFGGWQGCDHPSGLSCVMDMNNTQHTKKVYATFT